MKFKIEDQIKVIKIKDLGNGRKSYKLSALNGKHKGKIFYFKMYDEVLKEGDITDINILLNVYEY